MWNKQSNLLLIKISTGRITKLVIPFPLIVIDITLDALADLAWVIDKILLLWRRKSNQCYNGYKGHHYQWANLSIMDLVTTLRLSFKELRRRGRWTMVAVETGQFKVFVDFY